LTARLRIERTSWKDRSVLVTGAGGFVGSALARELLQRDARVIGVLRDSAGMRQLEAHGIQRRVDVVLGSINDFGLVRRVITQYEVDSVFHMAAHTSRQTAGRSPLTAFETNVGGTWNVLEAARLSPLVQSVVVASTDKAAWPDSQEETESSLRLDPYDASKACAEILARSYSASFPLPVAVVRCANVYGPGDANWSRLVPGMVRQALAGNDPILRSDGTPERDYLYLGDAVEGFLAVAEQLPEISGRAYSLGTGHTVSVLAMVRLILAAVGDPGLQPRIAGEANGVHRGAARPAAPRVPGWRPQVALAEGVARTVAWYRDHLASGRVVSLGERARA
jgi:CDP-glucose 4,6-dehydratase